MVLVAATNLDMHRVHLAGFVRPVCGPVLLENMARVGVINPYMQIAHQDWFVLQEPELASQVAGHIATTLLIPVASSSGLFGLHLLGQRQFCLMDIIARWP